MDLLNNIIEGMDMNWFFSTIATSSTVFITVMTSLVIYCKSEIKGFIKINNEEIDSLKEENIRNQEIIDKIVSPGNLMNVNMQQDYRRCAGMIMMNNARILKIEQEVVKSKTKEKRLENLIQEKILSFSILFIIFPLILLSLPNTKQVLIALNVVKIVLLFVLIYFITIFLKEFQYFMTLDTLNCNTNPDK